MMSFQCTEQWRQLLANLFLPELGIVKKYEHQYQDFHKSRNKRKLLDHNHDSMTENSTSLSFTLHEGSWADFFDPQIRYPRSSGI